MKEGETSKQNEARRQAELLLRKQDEEEEEMLSQLRKKPSYSSADLKGLKIMHDQTAFESGKDVVLTLADTSILETGNVLRI